MSSPSPDLTTEVAGRRVALSNLDKQLYPSGFTKAEVIAYYLEVAPVMLPHLHQRCITRLRFPNGTDQGSFYEKNAPAGTPGWVRIAEVTAADSLLRYVVAEDAATLVWLSNLAALELHTPQWRLDDAPSGEQPVTFDGANAVHASSLVVDLDPGPGIQASQIATAAMLAAHELAEAGLVPFVKGSGSKGMQVVAAIEPAPWRDAMEQVRRMGVRLARQHPDLFVTTMNKQARTDRIFLDHLQNRADRNTISVYSLRGRAKPTVSAPLSWDEVATIADGDEFQLTSDEVLARLASDGDLWAGLLDPANAAPLPDWPDDPGS
ncbi:non-homologous end-joining DNA ligase [Aestuariimicrobium ganziense]|uniref:non-homologous end-joining DNA ligase n=1 Tax=Aestuariimicrobium ganziense TaxID=2773677 RepID=UPI00194073EB|nr:non-homologous end-joining DNA ligase [Aestuariimicrobium ganziense]